MSRDELDELQRSTKFGPRGSTTPGAYRWSKYRTYGPAKGVTGETTFTFDEIADAWRRGLWRRDAQWRVVFTMMFGAIATVVGAMAAALVLGSATTRVVIAVCIAYGVVQAWRGIRHS